MSRDDLQDIDRIDGQEAAGDSFAEILPFPSNTRHAADEEAEVSFRMVLGDVLRDERLAQERVLADVAETAHISLPYLSEIERGRKDVSSDLLTAVSDALDLTLVAVLERCVDRLRAGTHRDSGIQLRAA